MVIYEECVIQTTANKFFGIEELKCKQREVIDHILNESNVSTSGGDFFCTFPTGYGKSICYLLPAIATNSNILVISPLCSLIADQMSRINTLSTATIAYDECWAHSTVGSNGATNQVSKILFCTPEKLGNDAFFQGVQRLHEQKQFAYIVVDEAHLLCQHGFTFRPDYLEIGKIRDILFRTPLYCFTATCNPIMKRMLIKSLKMKDVNVFAVDDTRTNLHLSMHMVSSSQKKCICTAVGCEWQYESTFDCDSIIQSIRCWGPGAVLFFANTRKEVEKIDASLCILLPDKKVSCYHGGLEDSTRSHIQSDFLLGNTDILVATMASFGVGVNMPRVCKIVVIGIPASIFDIIQIIGRGGRNGQQYFVDFFVKDADLLKQRHMLMKQCSKSPANYKTYVLDSFSMTEKFLMISKSNRDCLLNFLGMCNDAQRHELKVPYADLNTLKAINSRCEKEERAQWDGISKRWFLPPLRYNSSFDIYGLQANTQVIKEGCHKCTSCKLQCQKKRLYSNI